MPYPDSCPECGSQFRNTGTHFTARRNEVGRHVLLELGCQNTSRRFWWDFTAGQLTDDGRRSVPMPREALVTAAATSNLNGHTNGHAGLATLDVAKEVAKEVADEVAEVEDEEPMMSTIASEEVVPEPETSAPPAIVPPAAPAPEALRDAFTRQLQLDRLTLRQMRSLLMAEEARRAIEVAVGATEATYERLALILFGTDLQQLLGKPAAAPVPVISAEERLELQREKARIRARVRRAAIKAAREA